MDKQTAWSSGLWIPTAVIGFSLVSGVRRIGLMFDSSVRGLVDGLNWAASGVTGNKPRRYRNIHDSGYWFQCMTLGGSDILWQPIKKRFCVVACCTINVFISRILHRALDCRYTDDYYMLNYRDTVRTVCMFEEHPLQLDDGGLILQRNAGLKITGSPPVPEYCI